MKRLFANNERVELRIDTRPILGEAVVLAEFEYKYRHAVVIHVDSLSGSFSGVDVDLITADPSIRGFHIIELDSEIYTSDGYPSLVALTGDDLEPCYISHANACKHERKLNDAQQT